MLNKEEIAIIKAHAATAEECGKLTPELLALVYKNNWFKLFVPKVYGGPGKQLPEILRLEEALATADGSLAWTVTLCAGAAWFAGFLDPALANELFTDEKVCFAGSGAVGGTATATDKGYRIEGHWKYASGALHATVFTANCILKDVDGSDVLDDDGKPIIESFILKKEEVRILPGWSYFGLMATGSHAFEVDQLEVPKNRSFNINTTITCAEQGFDYPFLQLAETTLAVNSLGMALHFIELISASFYSRSGLKRYTEAQLAFFEKELTECKTKMEELKTEFYQVFDVSWAQLLERQEIEEAVLQKVSYLSRKLAHQSRNCATILYPYGGLEAAKKESTINRVWRDLHTASQHALLTFLSEDGV